MELFSTAWQFLSSVLIFAAGILVAISVGRRFNTTARRSLTLYGWHTIFCIIATLYLVANGGDAIDYYKTALAGNVEFSVGTAAVSFITVFFTSVLGLSFLGASLVYQIAGFIGLLAFDASLQAATAEKSKYVRRLATLIVFLPSVSFWSSAIGKDSLSFMAVGFALWAALNLKRRVWLMVASVAIMLLVRPHIAGMIVIAFAGSLIIKRNIPLARRLGFGIATLVAAALIVPFAMTYAGLESAVTAQDLNNYIEQRQQQNLEGSASFDLAAMTPPMQLFTYLFRPLPFEARTFFALAASLDNVILLMLFIAGGWSILKRHRPTIVGNRGFLWLYSLLAWSLLAMTTANLGISLRQKWMFAPMMILLLISLIGRPRRKLNQARTLVRYSVPAPHPDRASWNPVNRGAAPRWKM
jgi:hypothetical protein